MSPLDRENCSIINESPVVCQEEKALALSNWAEMIRIAILLSGRHGRGSNMQAIAEACADGRIHGRVAAVVGNYEESPALARARDLQVAASVVPSPAAAGPAAEEAYGAALLKTLDAFQPDLVCLAGYIRKVPACVVSAYAGRMMNIHNALLPAFGGRGMFGRHVHQAVLDYGVKVSGCTVHFVDESYDTGPIILQSVVPVLDDDDAETLSARVLVAEHEAYPQAVSLFAAGRLIIKGRRVNVA
jgi:phosphoribosylglycinamide formyltransferase-1